MAYVGGKARRCEHILSLLNHPEFDGMDYLEPFVGYAHILRRVENKKRYDASDVNSTLITLLKGVQKGQRFPKISRAEYERLRPQKHDKSFRRAVAAFAYSYKGSEWIGYFNECPERNRMYAQEHKRYYDKLHDNDIFQDTHLRSISYRGIHPKDKLVYCDPPYRATTKYNEGSDFDHDLFWSTMREWSRRNIVFVSEYRAPSDFACVASCEKYNNLAPQGEPDLRIERVFVHKSLLPKVREIARDAKHNYARATPTPAYRGSGGTRRRTKSARGTKSTQRVTKKSARRTNPQKKRIARRSARRSREKVRRR